MARLLALLVRTAHRNVGFRFGFGSASHAGDEDPTLIRPPSDSHAIYALEVGRELA
jgi:hypothetical protein